MPLQVPDDLVVARSEAAKLLRHRSTLVASPLDRVGRGLVADIDAQLKNLIDALRVDPCDASAEVPLVLLPVRVECKLAGQILQVRITPDEIHADGLSRMLSDAEADAAQTYWTGIWAAPDAPTAWSDLVEAIGADRAGWAARAMTPTNLEAFGTGAPDFPEPPTEVADGTVVRCLPDRFVVQVTLPGGIVRTATGNPVPPDLKLSPLALDDEDLTDLDGLVVPVGAEWTVDFERAKEVGLGIAVDLQTTPRVIESVIVVGVRTSVSEAENARDLAELLVSHAHTDGFDLLPHGTPTNNADLERSRYRRGPTAVAPATAAVAPSAEATETAALLGVDASVVESLLNPALTRSTLGATQRSANTALWWATWEYVLDQVIDKHVPGMTPAKAESARRVHRDDVRAAGHSSALRVGAQPYGILPVADLSAWQPQSGEITASLVPLVQRTLDRWATRAAGLPRMRPDDDVTDEEMLGLLGTSPIAIGVRSRPALNGPDVEALGGSTGISRRVLSAESTVVRAIMAQFSPALAKQMSPVSVAGDARRLPLPLVSERDAEVIADILADRSPKVDSVLQALLDIAWDAASRTRFRSAPSAYVSPLLEYLNPDATIVGLTRAAAASGSFGALIEAVPASSPQEFFAAAETLRSTVHFDGQTIEPVSIAEIEPVAEARTSLGQVALDLGDTPQAKWIAQDALADLLHGFGIAWEVRDAMLALGAAPIDERRIAVASALDVTAHRVDAWASGIAHARHRTLAHGEGVTIGAFGIIEDIRVGLAAREPKGWLHAPSPSHAVAGGMLASAHESNIGAKPGQRPFAIDLSSSRGVELRRILEGMRRGQTIGAMLGYQIERALTEGGAGRFQLSLRQIAPINTDELEADAGAQARTARMAAADVVDGVELLRLYPVAELSANPPKLRTRLSQAPVNDYITGAWQHVTEPEWETIKAALQGAAKTMDAVSDALLSEAVLQYASGNAARARAAMDASGIGESVDPDLDVLSVRQSGRTLTHSAYALVPENAVGWSTTRPRAIAEPRLEAWAARRLGDPGDIVVSDSPGGRLTLADAGFAALDLVFADDLAGLDRDLRASLPAMGDIALDRGAGWPEGARSVGDAAALAQTLRTILAGGTPMTPDRLVGASDQPQHAIDVGELLARCDALLAALETALQHGEATITAIDPDTLAIDEADAPALAAAVAPLAAFGVPLTRNEEVLADARWAVGAWQGAAARYVSGSAALAALRAPATDLTDAQILDRVTALAQTVFGDGFVVAPVMRHIAGEGNDLDRAIRLPRFAAPPAARLAAFVRDHAAVREGMGRLAEAQLLGRASGVPITLRAAQHTAVADDGTPDDGADRWLAGDLPDEARWPRYPATHLVLELVGSPAASADDVAGILFDSWTEALPHQPDERAFDDRNPAPELRQARATTGLAIHARQASARAPQVILSAVSPDGRRWTTASTIGVVRHAMTLAKARTVTYEKLHGDAAVLPAAYVASAWLQARKGFFFQDLTTVDWARIAYPFVSEVK